MPCWCQLLAGRAGVPEPDDGLEGNEVGGVMMAPSRGGIDVPLGLGVLGFQSDSSSRPGPYQAGVQHVPVQVVR